MPGTNRRHDGSWYRAACCSGLSLDGRGDAVDDPTTSVDGWRVAGWLWGILMSLFAWIGLTKVKEVDALKRDCVTTTACEKTTNRIREDFDNTCRRLEKSLEAHRAETQEGFRAAREDLQRIADRLDRITEVRRATTI